MAQGDAAAFFGIAWPKGGEGKPGEGGPQLTLWPCIRQLLQVIDAQYDAFKPKPPNAADPAALRIPHDIDVLMAEAGVKIKPASVEQPQHAFGRFS